jgi:hypothetical protein
MKLTPPDRQRIEHCLEQLAAWRQSGMALKKYTEHHGHHYPQWRAWLGVEAHWRQTLSGATPTTFFQARAAKSTPPTAPASLRIALQSQSGPLVASIDWPLECPGAASALAAWLQEVLA